MLEVDSALVFLPLLLLLVMAAAVASVAIVAACGMVASIFIERCTEGSLSSTIDHCTALHCIALAVSVSEGSVQALIAHVERECEVECVECLELLEEERRVVGALEHSGLIVELIDERRRHQRRQR